MRNLLTLFDLNTAEIHEIFEIARHLKTNCEQGIREPLLRGRVMGLLFEKPSLRTRVSFEAGMTHLGGSCQYLGRDVGWGQREAAKDFAEVLSQYVDVIVFRTRDHQQVDALAQYSSCPVINGLTDMAHPCQALTDLFTIQEIHGTLDGKSVAYIGDGNNVARSLAIACAMLDVRFRIATPPGYQFNGDFLSQLQREIPHLQLDVSDDPTSVVAGTSCVYTDVWASMGQESEHARRQHDFSSFQVNAELMSRAPENACFMHCLPAHRGEEVTDEVIDGPQSVVVLQAANRMHVQKGILVWLLGTNV